MGRGSGGLSLKGASWSGVAAVAGVGGCSKTRARGILMTWPQCEQRPRLPCDRSSTLNRLPQFSHVKMIDMIDSVVLAAAAGFEVKRVRKTTSFDLVSRISCKVTANRQFARRSGQSLGPFVTEWIRIGFLVSTLRNAVPIPPRLCRLRKVARD